MDPRTRFLLQLLQKLGAPLMAAVESRATPGDASTLAALVSESIKVSIALSQAMNLKTEDGNADAIRVALAALSGGLIADTYRATGRIPNDNDVQRITKSLESVIVFADNFAPAAEHAARLETLEGAPPFFDPVQTSIYSLHALLPVIAAVGEFSFGQPETRLIQEISERLGARAGEIRKRLSVGGNAMAELVILQALGQIYAGAHKAETARLNQGGDGAGQSSMEAVWQSFDRQVAMLEILVGAMAQGEAVAAQGGGSSAVRPDDVTAPVVEQAPPPATAPVPAEPPAAPPAGASPMAFFKKK